MYLSLHSSTQFLAHLIDFYQMCYCCRKLEISLFSMYFSDSQIWEAVCVRGRAPLIGSDRSDHITEPIRGARPLTHTASQIESPKFGLTSTRPHNICHVICLSQSAEHGLSCTRPLRSVRPWESEVPIGLSRTPGEAMRLAVKSVRRPRGSDCIARCAWEADLWGRGSPIGLSRTAAIWLISRLNALLRPVESDRTLTASQIGLTDHMTFGLSRPLTHTASQIWESDRPLTHTGRSNAFSCEISQIAPRIGLSAAVRERPIGLSNLWGRVHERPCAWEAVGVRKSCDLSESPHRSDSLTDLTD